MNIKKFYARDMRQAMENITKELGSNAVILNSSKVRKKGLRGLFEKPVFEVMVAYDPTETPLARRLDNYRRGGRYVPSPAVPAPEPQNIDQLAQSVKNAQELAKAAKAEGEPPLRQMAELDGRLTELGQMLSGFMDKFKYIKRDVTYDYSPEIQDMLHKMIDIQVREELAHSLAKETQEILKRRKEAQPREIMEQLMLEHMSEPQPLMVRKYKRKVVIVLGPTGVGKTTSIVKLAAHFAIKEKKKVGIINTDTYRIAAHAQLKTYVDILDIPLGIAYNPEDIVTALEEQNEMDVVFVDTAGQRPGSPEHQTLIKDLIALSGAEDILLTISAPTGFAACREIIDSYGFLPDFKLLITKVDETGGYGNILNVCWYSEKPLSYITIGQSVPDDIKEADPKEIVNKILS